MNLINNLPAHVLLVHAVVIFVPVAALMTVLAAVWPAARRRLGFLTPLVALVGLVFVPLTTEAGEWLEAHLPPSDLIEKHAGFGDGLLPWAAGLFLVAAVSWLQHSRWLAPRESDDDASARFSAPAGVSAIASARWAQVAVAVVAVAIATGAVVQTVRAGDSGAQAAWSDQELTSNGHADSDG